MPTSISGNDGVDKVKDGTLVVADAKSGEPVGFNRMQLFAAKATTSGTSVDFSPADGTGIPSWAKRITLNLKGVSLSGTSHLLFQLGAGSIQTTGYEGTSLGQNSAGGAGDVSSTSGLPLYSGTAAHTVSGQVVLTLVGYNSWVITGNAKMSSAALTSCGGNVTIFGTLDRIRLTTVNGTDTFDAGSVSILVEGYA